MRLIDRDWVEWDNLPRQALFTEQDARERTPKAIAAQAHLKSIDSSMVIESIVEDLTYRNAMQWLGDVDVICDGTDNFETRFLINDVSLEKRLPWVHGGCVAASGQVMVIVPGVTACFRCLIPDVPAQEAQKPAIQRAYWVQPCRQLLPGKPPKPSSCYVVFEMGCSRACFVLTSGMVMFARSDWIQPKSRRVVQHATAIGVSCGANRIRRPRRFVVAIQFRFSRRSDR